jgi:hypothetical protein
MPARKKMSQLLPFELPPVGITVVAVVCGPSRSVRVLHHETSAPGGELTTRFAEAVNTLQNGDAGGKSAPRECVVASPRHYQVLYPLPRQDESPDGEPDHFVYLVFRRDSCNFAMALYQSRDIARRLAAFGGGE